MELKNGIPTTTAKNAEEWRSWLLKNHEKEKAIWLVIYHQKSDVASVQYDEAVDEALCFGWIDSKPNKRDDLSYYQYFSQRNPKSNWSRINKGKIAKLMQANKMESAGLRMIEVAKKNGTWDALNDVENLVVPPDMLSLFQSEPEAQKNFEAFPPSVRRGILEWIFNAKKEETRSKRITETVALARQNIRANQFRK